MILDFLFQAVETLEVCKLEPLLDDGLSTIGRRSSLHKVGAVRHLYVIAISLGCDENYEQLRNRKNKRV